MEQIKAYLNNLFLGLPETPEVLRAKAELLEMMEDKYEELTSNGKSDQEAFGIVVSEFGNLEELAEALGIQETINQQKQTNNNSASGKKTGSNYKAADYNQTVSEIWDETRTNAFLEMIWNHAKLMALGVAFFILAPICQEITEDSIQLIASDSIADVISNVIFFGIIAAGVVLCIHSKHIRGVFGYEEKQIYGLNYTSANLLKQKREHDEESLYKMKVTGILLCILSVLPNILINTNSGMLDDLADLITFLMIAVGVFFLTVRGSVCNRYDEMKRAKLYKDDQTSELHADYFVEPKHKKLSGGAIAAIVAACILVVLVLLITFFVAMFSYIGDNVADTVTDSVEDSSSIAGLEPNYLSTTDVTKYANINMELSNATVTVEPSKEDMIEVYSKGNGEIPSVTEHNDTITIRDNKDLDIHFYFPFDLTELFNGNGVNKNTTKVVIKVPQKNNYTFHCDINAGNITFNHIEATGVTSDSDASSIKINNCTFDSQELNSDAGNIKITDSTINHAIYDTDAGNIKVDQSNIKKLKCDTDAGNIHFINSIFDTINCDLDAGNFKCENSNFNSDEYNIELSTELGKVTFFGDSSRNHFNKNGSNQQKKITVKNSMGNISIN